MGMLSIRSQALVACAQLLLGGAAAGALAATPPAATATAAAARDLVAGAAPTAGKTCKLELSSNDAMQYDRKELRIAADCRNIELRFRHTGRLPAQAMGHNWVLTRTSDARAVDSAGIAAGFRNNHVPTGDKRVIAASRIIAGGQSITITFSAASLVRGGDYTFFCSFPGHFGIMKGKLIVG